MKVRIGLLVLALALLLLPAAASSAEPDRSATLNAANPSFTWQSTGTGAPDPSGSAQIRCTPVYFDCEYILLDVETAGELTLTLDATAGVLRNIDGHVYKSTATGKPMSRSLTKKGCVTDSPRETCTVAVAPGFYVVEVEYRTAVAAAYTGTVELVPAVPAPNPLDSQTLTLDTCKFTLYYFKDSAERLRPSVPAGYVLRPYPSGPSAGTATIAAAAYACDRLDVPGSPPGPATFTVLSVLVYPPEQTAESPAVSDFYVLWVHADNQPLVDLLASRGMPAHHVPGMKFEKPLLSVAVRVDVPWSSGAFELGATGYHQDIFHPHDNSFLHLATDGRPMRMDFLTHRARDHFCYQPSYNRDVGCGHLKAEAGTPVGSFFGAATRSADNVWDHDPVPRAWLVLH